MRLSQPWEPPPPWLQRVSAFSASAVREPSGTAGKSKLPRRLAGRPQYRSSGGAHHAVKRGHLRYFVTVAEEGQITRAAGKLHIAQPALSQAMAQLESELGIKLLKRHARGVTLTPAGEAFLAKARIALAADDDAAQTARWLARVARGAMDVGFIGPPPTLNAPELFTAFADSDPGAEVSFRDVTFPCGATLSWLEELDVVFCHQPDADPGVEMQAVRLEPRALVRTRVIRSPGEGSSRSGRCSTRLSSATTPRSSRRGPAFTASMTIVAGRPEDDRRARGKHNADGRDNGSGGGITTLPRCDAKLAQQVLPVVEIPLSDARPAVLSLVWRRDNHNPLLRALVAFAGSLAESQLASRYLSRD